MSDHAAEEETLDGSPVESHLDSPGVATKPPDVGSTDDTASTEPSIAEPSAEEVAFVDLLTAANLGVFLLPLREAGVTTAAAARAQTARDKEFLSRLGLKKVRAMLLL